MMSNKSALIDDKTDKTKGRLNLLVQMFVLKTIAMHQKDHPKAFSKTCRW